MSISEHTIAAKRRSGREQGIALVMTLAILVLITLLVVAFAISMRVEQTSSKNFNDLIKARQIAQGAADQAVATLRAATPVITNLPSLVTYVTSPGAIFTYQNNSWTNIALFTTNSVGGSYDLNQGNWITGTNAYYPIPNPPITNSALFVTWSNIVVNGQLVGRFAYWVDDESAKVNINVAGTRGSDLEGQSPDAIDLQALFIPANQINITNFVAMVTPFDSLESILMVTSSVPGALFTVNPPAGGFVGESDYYANKFYMTANSTSPDFTPWGAKRINLSNLVANATTPVLKQALVLTIANDLSDGNLNIWFGKTFANKYPTPLLQQIAANIIDYIDSDSIPTDSSTVGWNDTAVPQYLGLEVTPYLNEIAISNHVAVGFDPQSGNSTLTFSTYPLVELWYMYTNQSWNATTLGGNNEVFLTGLNQVSVTVSALPPGLVGSTPPPATPIVNIPLPSTGTISIPGTTVMVTNSYQVFVPPSQLAAPTFYSNTNILFVTLNAGTITAIFRNNSLGRYDYASIYLTNYQFKIDTKATPSTNLFWASGCNDPRVKPVSNTWQPEGPGAPNGMTLGLANTGITNVAVVTTVSGVGIQGDGDTSCHIVSGSRDRGTMYPGEMAFIHTGIPWRTFWLQPEPPTESAAPTIPDWAVLDLFSGSVTTNAAAMTNVVGRMNINAVISNGFASSFPQRIVPLAALLTNNLGASDPNYSIIVATNDISLPDQDLQNVHNYFSSVVGPGFPVSAFTFIGEICEVNGVASNPPPPAFHNKSVAETPVRGIANLITTRSNTFSIWAVGQSIKDVNKNGVYDPGVDIITGEARIQAIVERYEDYSTSPATVKFRTLYYRFIY